MPQYDLAGNPLPDPSGSAGAEPPRLDLAGNPLPPAPSSMPPPSLHPSPLPPGGGHNAPPRPGGGYNVPPRPGGMAPSRATAAPEEGGGRRWLWISLGVVVLVALLGTAYLLTPKRALVPTTFTAYAAPDKSFGCDAPDGWSVTPADKSHQMAGSDSTTGGVLFASGSSSIDVTTDTLATVVAAGLMAGQSDAALTGSHAAALHKQWKKMVAAPHKGYEETQVADFESAMGDARLAEWTASGNVLGLGGAMHGYRASLAGGSHTAEVVCQCPEGEWTTLKPAFQRVLASVHEGAEPVGAEPGGGAAGVPGTP